MSDELSNPTLFTSRTSRTVRAILAWSQSDLAKAIGVRASAIADFERGRGHLPGDSIQNVRNVLGDAGIQLLSDGTIISPPVPALLGSGRPGLPHEWISAKDLAAWVEGPEGAGKFPRLIRYLVRATHGAAARMRFPSEEATWHPGLDGSTTIEEFVAALDTYIRWYNGVRIKSSLGFLSPANHRKKLGIAA